jgi:hypothetical protein
MDMLE